MIDAAKTDTAPVVTVLLATCNRAETLRQTLESMAGLDRDPDKSGTAEFVVVDNNSSDHTKEVVESFAGRLPVRYLFEPQAGKNNALNKALGQVRLGKLVVFTDDDVVPQSDWLTAVVEASRRRPGQNVFGGKVYPIWPDGELPDWTNVTWISQIGFAAHDYSGQERLYKDNEYPFGSNMWVRREVFEGGRRFDESIGPRPGSYIMGSETSFLRQLRRDGYEMVYCPRAVVGHRVERRQLAISSIKARAYRCGRSGPHLDGLCRAELFERHPALWIALRAAATVKAFLKYLAGYVHTSHRRRVAMQTGSLIAIGYNVESIRLALEKLRNGNNNHV